MILRGQGKYDAQLSEALRQAGARQGCLMVLDGDKGASFCVKMREDSAPELPGLLRSLAHMIEKDVNAIADDEIEFDVSKSNG